MSSNPLREIVTVSRLSQVSQLLEQYNSIPVLLIGVTLDESKGALIFSLDTKLTIEDNLLLLNSVIETLEIELGKKSITNGKL